MTTKLITLHKARNLAQGPNIVLVTGNLIFFIPSAVKIYKSLSFLQSSIPKQSLSKMETCRYSSTRCKSCARN